MLVTFGSEKPRRTESRNTKLDIVIKDGSILTIEQMQCHKLLSQYRDVL